MAYRWFKAYIEFLDDPKMARLPDRLWRRTWEMFAFARKTGDDGRLPDIEDMAWVLHLEPDELEADLLALADLPRPIVHRRLDGSWIVTNFAKRQAAEPSVERTAASRERDRIRPAPVTIRDYIVTSALPDQIRSDQTETEIQTEIRPDQTSDAPSALLPAAAPVLPVETVETAENGDGDGSDSRQLLVAFGVGDPALSKYASLPVDSIAAHIAYVTGRENVRNPVGLLIRRLEAGQAAPRASPRMDDPRRFIEGQYAAFIEH